jgi:hypothetical protein
MSGLRVYQDLTNNAATSQAQYKPQKKQGRRQTRLRPALTYLLLLAAGTRGTAVTGSAAFSLRRRRCTRHSQRDYNHQQHYF